MRLPLVLFCFGLAACDVAGPGFLNAPVVRVTEGGSKFTLRRRGAYVEAIRTSPEFLPRFHDVALRAGLATQRETGCRADWIMGDPALMYIGLDCGAEPAPPMPRKRHMFFCDVNGAGRGDLDLECSKA